jgi:parallel beta-helix repeat protein
MKMRNYRLSTIDCRLKLAIVVSLSLILPRAVCFGATYHVDRAHPSADDSNSGTAEEPWKTIGKAASEAGAGDTVYVHEGAYSEFVYLTGSGTPEALITFKAVEGDNVVIDGEGTAACCMRINSGSYYRIEGFTMQNVTNIILDLRRAGHNQIVNNTLQHADGTGVLNHSGRGIHINKENADYNLIQGNTIYDVDYTGIEVSRGSDYNTIEGNEISYCGTEGIIVNNVGTDGIGIKIISNTIHHIFSEDGIDLKCGRDHLVTGNTIYDCSNYGIQVFERDGDANALIERNTIYSCGGGGINVYEGDYVIRSNIIYNNGYEEPLVDRVGGGYTYKPCGFGIELGMCRREADGTPIANRIQIYNNTLYKNECGEIWIFGGLYTQDGHVPLDVSLRNNIMVGASGGTLLKVCRVGTQQLQSDHNLMVVGTDGAFAEWNCTYQGGNSTSVAGAASKADSTSLNWKGIRYTDFEQYRSATSRDRHSICPDP